MSNRVDQVDNNGQVILLAKAGRRENSAPEQQSAESTNLDKAIRAKREKIASTTHFGEDAQGNYGRETYYIQLIPLLLAKGGLKSDKYPDLTCREEAALTCSMLFSVINAGSAQKNIAIKDNLNVSGTIADYFKAVAKIYLGEAMLMDVNDGVCKNVETEKAYLDAAEKYAVAGATELLTCDKVTHKVNYYEYFHARMLIAKVKHERRGIEDTDASIGNICDEIIGLAAGGVTNTPEGLAGKMTFTGRNADIDKQETIVGLKSVINSARLVKISLALSDQNTEEIKTAISDISGVIAGFGSLEKEIDKIPGYRGRLETEARPSPTQNFDCFSARSLLGDLQLKYLNLTGRTFDGSSAKNILAIYESIYGPKDFRGSQVAFYGNYPRYFEALSRIGQINYAISIDKLKDLYKVKTKTDAVNAALKDLQEVRGKIPPDKYLSLQAKLLEANLRMMVAAGIDEEAGKLAAEVVSKLSTINDRESRSDLSARAYLVLARVTALKTQNDPDPELQLITLSEAGKYLNQALASANEYSAVSKGLKKMDASYYAELYHTSASIYSQIVWANKGIAEDLGDAGDDAAAATYRAGFNDYASKAEANFGKATTYCRAENGNVSAYDLNVRSWIVALELQSLGASRITLKRSDNAQENLSKLEGIYKQIEAKIPSDPDQADYVRGLITRTKINVLASMIFLMNNNDMSTSEIEAKYAEIGRLKSELDKNPMLTESEMFYVNQTIIGASMAMLRNEKVRSTAIRTIGSVYESLKGKELTYEMCEACALYATSGTPDEMSIGKRLEKELKRILGEISMAKTVAVSRKNLALSKINAKLGDILSWILSKQANNRPNVKVLGEAIKDYQAAVNAGDTSLVTMAKLEQSKLILLLNKDIKRDVLDEKGRRALAAERVKAFQSAVLALNAIVAAGAKSQKPKDRGDYGSKDVQAKIMARQWLGTIKVTMAGMLDMGLVTPEDLTLVGIAGTTVAEINKDAVSDFDNAISLYTNISLNTDNKIGSAQKASLGLNIAFVYSGKANALATVAFNANSQTEKNTIFGQVDQVIKAGIKGAQDEKDRIAEGTMFVLSGNISFWQAGNVEAAMAGYEKGFSLITGMSIDALAGSDYVGIGLVDLAHYADAKALSTYKKGVSDDERRKAAALLQKIIGIDGDISVYSASAHMRKGDLVIATTRDQRDKDASLKLGEAVADFTRALDILTGTKLDIGKHLAMFRAARELNKDQIEVLCRLIEAEVRLYNTQIDSESDKAKRWNKEYGLVNKAREIVKSYLVQLGIWQPSDDIENMGSIIDERLTGNPDTKDIGGVLKRVVSWRAALIQSGMEREIPGASGATLEKSDLPQKTGD